MESGAVACERRRPETTVLYRTLQEHLATFRARLETAGDSLPGHVDAAFDATLECGMLQSGFARVRCPRCAHDRLVAFSCKQRGICPSCEVSPNGTVGGWAGRRKTTIDAFVRLDLL